MNRRKEQKCLFLYNNLFSLYLYYIHQQSNFRLVSIFDFLIKLLYSKADISIEESIKDYISNNCSNNEK